MEIVHEKRKKERKKNPNTQSITAKIPVHAWKLFKDLDSFIREQTSHGSRSWATWLWTSFYVVSLSQTSRPVIPD